MDRQTTIERLEEMEQWLLDKSYSDLRARDHYEIVGAAIDLLKAQEPKSPIVKENAYGWKFFYCPSCGREFNANRKHGRMNEENFCDKCGQAVKWDD